MQNGSPSSNEIEWSGRVIFQFIVKLATAQSVSTSPSSAQTPSLGQLAGPRTSRLKPGGVRNRYGTANVSTPEPKWLEANLWFAGQASPYSTRIASRASEPSQVAVNAAGFLRTHPASLAISNGRHRFALRPAVSFIQSRHRGAGSISGATSG